MILLLGRRERTLTLFRGKCYIVVLLQFSVTRANLNSLYYMLSVTKPDLVKESETVITTEQGELPLQQLQKLNKKRL